jgi:uncharacterized membrane protein YfcA
LSNILLILLGIFVGTLGTLIGAGGGFILVPALLILHPDYKAESITSLSLAVVFINALSGSISYSKQKKIDYKTAFYFALATIPTSILGVLSISYIPRNIFNAIFGILMIILSLFLFTQKKHKIDSLKELEKEEGFVTREIIDSKNNKYLYSFDLKKGISFSFLVGYLSSLLGIGGGIMMVPFMINILNFPIQIATATSQFILMIMSFSGTLSNIYLNKFHHDLNVFIFLSLGVILGAQIGAYLSQKIKNNIIVKILAISLGLSGFKIFISVF